jgi:hypothetical protein
MFLLLSERWQSNKARKKTTNKGGNGNAIYDFLVYAYQEYKVATPHVCFTTVSKNCIEERFAKRSDH